MLEDGSPESFSALEALDDIADIVETIVFSFVGEQERDAYLALADQYESYADSLPEEAVQRTPEENRRLMELAQLVSDAFKPMIQACPAHIRKVYDAVREALDAEEASSS